MGFDFSNELPEIDERMQLIVSEAERSQAEPKTTHK
jgi:hypothetical protein